MTIPKSCESHRNRNVSKLLQFNFLTISCSPVLHNRLKAPCRNFVKVCERLKSCRVKWILYFCALPFWRCTSAWTRCCAACGPAALCCPSAWPYRCGPASARRWTPPPGAWTWCPCCRSRRCAFGRSREASGSPAGRRIRSSLDCLCH